MSLGRVFPPSAANHTVQPSQWPHTESYLPPISPHRRPPYQELWRLDLSTWEWDQLPQKGGSCPSARSGHRMALHKGRIIMFGGFFDNGKEVK